MDSKTSWDSLRKQARKLEAQLDDQMHLFRKLVYTKGDNDKENNLGSAIEQLLEELERVISLMQAWLSSGGSEIFSHTLTRHREIHHDLTQEFNRLRSSLRAQRDHASLLEDFREFERSRSQLEDDGGSQEQSLLKERGTLMRSTGKMDGVIAEAQETLGTLVFQRSTFGGINSKISNVNNRLPTVTWRRRWLTVSREEDEEEHQGQISLPKILMWTKATHPKILRVNNILSTIKKKKSMDTIILSMVASVCTFLILIYWLAK